MEGVSGAASSAGAGVPFSGASSAHTGAARLRHSAAASAAAKSRIRPLMPPHLPKTVEIIWYIRSHPAPAYKKNDGGMCGLRPCSQAQGARHTKAAAPSELPLSMSHYHKVTLPNNPAPYVPALFPSCLFSYIALSARRITSLAYSSVSGSYTAMPMDTRGSSQICSAAPHSAFV